MVLYELVKMPKMEAKQKKALRKAWSKYIKKEKFSAKKEED